MFLQPTRWRDVESGDRVIDPTGKMFHVLPRLLPTLVQVRGSDGRTHTLFPNPETMVPVVRWDVADVATRNLRKRFEIEFLWSR